jgi:hypothetical protein
MAMAMDEQEMLQAAKSGLKDLRVFTAALIDVANTEYWALVASPQSLTVTGKRLDSYENLQTHWREVYEERLTTFNEVGNSLPDPVVSLIHEISCVVEAILAESDMHLLGLRGMLDQANLTCGEPVDDDGVYE